MLQTLIFETFRRDSKKVLAFNIQIYKIDILLQKS